MSTIDVIKKIKENSRKRKFTQSWDISIGLKGIDLRKPENRINAEFVLPEGRGKDQKIVVIADSLAADAKKHADLVVTKQQLEELIKNKKKIKKLADDYDRILCEAGLMAVVGKNMGAVLGPRGKVPKPIPPKADIAPFVQMARKTIRVSLRESPVIHLCVGTESMSEEHVANNVDSVLDFIKSKLPKGANNIKTAYLKLTMSKPEKLEI